MKRSLNSYFRSLGISSAALFSAIILLLGVCEAFEGTREVGFGEKTSAIELIYGASDDITGIRVLDFEIFLPFIY